MALYERNQAPASTNSVLLGVSSVAGWKHSLSCLNACHAAKYARIFDSPMAVEQVPQLKHAVTTALQRYIMLRSSVFPQGYIALPVAFTASDNSRQRPASEPTVRLLPRE